MEFSWLTFAFAVINIALWLIICAIPVILIVWLVSMQKRLARIETAFEELRKVLPPDSSRDRQG